MTNSINITRLLRIAEWLDELPDVVTVHPEIRESDVTFHLNHRDDWREQAVAIIATLDVEESKVISNFITVDGSVKGGLFEGEVSLFIPAHLKPTEVSTVSVSDLIAEANA